MRKIFSKKGQATFESVLLMAIILLVWIGLTSALKKANFYQTLFGTPWARLTNTMEFGIPTAQRQSAAPLHPTAFIRHSTVLNENQ
jgi:hypothetical protein